MSDATLRAVRTQLRAVGVSITHSCHRYRVNFTRGQEATASYHYDLVEARDAGMAMAARLADLRDEDPAPGVPVFRAAREG